MMRENRRRIPVTCRQSHLRCQDEAQGLSFFFVLFITFYALAKDSQ